MPCSAALPGRPRFQAPTLKSYCRPRPPFRGGRRFATLTRSGWGAPGVCASALGEKGNILRDQNTRHPGGAAPRERVLALCAAPGGKTTLLARAVGPSGSVIAGDLHQHRLRSMREQLARTKTGNVHLLALDATQPLPFAGPRVRAVLAARANKVRALLSARANEVRAVL